MADEPVYLTPDEAYAQGDSGANQNIVSRMVEREVLCCASSAISDVITLMQNVDYGVLRNCDLDEAGDSGIELSRCEADPCDVARDNGAYLIERDGEWYCLGDLPDQTAPPKDTYVGRAYDTDGKTVYFVADDIVDTVRCPIAAVPAGTRLFDDYCDVLEHLWDDYFAGLDSFDTDDEAARDWLESERIDLSDYDHEVYEHWIVTGWLADKLRRQGQKVLDVLGWHIYCRCCTGQAMFLDSCMQRIAANQEILVGQRYDWSRNSSRTPGVDMK